MGVAGLVPELMGLISNLLGSQDVSVGKTAVHVAKALFERSLPLKCRLLRSTFSINWFLNLVRLLLESLPREEPAQAALSVSPNASFHERNVVVVASEITTDEGDVRIVGGRVTASGLVSSGLSSFLLTVADLIDYAVVADANAPEALFARKLLLSSAGRLGRPFWRLASYAARAPAAPAPGKLTCTSMPAAVHMFSSASMVNLLMRPFIR